MTRRNFMEVASQFAGHQYGVVTRRQLLSAGVTRHSIDGQVKRRQPTRLHRGVFLLGSLRLPLSQEMAAILACGPGACLSHLSASRLWGLLPCSSSQVGLVEVSVKAGRRSHPRIRVHRPRRLDDQDITTYQLIPVTTPVRTVFDLASVVRARTLERAVAEGVAKRLMSEAELTRVVAGRDHARGFVALRDVLGGGGPARTRSVAEDAFLDLVRRARLDAPRVNARVGEHEVDFYWPVHRLVVEVDGRAFHTSRHAFERDQRRDAELVARGIRVMRVTWRQITDEAEAVLVRLGAALLAEVGTL